MDTMYRNKAREAQEGKSSRKEKKSAHASDLYSSKVRPREVHPDDISAEQRISKNLNKLNRRLVDTPASEMLSQKTEKEELAVLEDRGAKVVTHAAGIKAPVPLAIIFSCAIIALIFMYMLSLSIQIEEYSQSIDQMESEISELKDEATKLEVRLENKYDLGEVERIATQEYGMVTASSLPKKYISVASDQDVWEEVITIDEPIYSRLFKDKEAEEE